MLLTEPPTAQQVMKAKPLWLDILQQYNQQQHIHCHPYSSRLQSNRQLPSHLSNLLHLLQQRVLRRYVSLQTLWTAAGCNHSTTS